MDQRIGYNELSADGEWVYICLHQGWWFPMCFKHIWDDDPHDYVNV